MLLNDVLSESRGVCMAYVQPRVCASDGWHGTLVVAVHDAVADGS